MFAQLRHRERRAGRAHGLYFWRDRTREVDFVSEVGGRVELFEAKWTELATERDLVTLDAVAGAIGRSRVRGGGIVCRAPNSYPLSRAFQALPITAIE